MSALPPGYVLRGDGTAYNPAHVAGNGTSAEPAAAFVRETPSPADPYDHALQMIAHRAGGLRCSLGPEDRVQAEIVRGFDNMVRRREACVLAVMLANEVRQPRGLSRIAAMQGARLLAMGLCPGASDLILLWPGDGPGPDGPGWHAGSGFLEVKRPARVEQRLDGKQRYAAGRLSEAQKDFRALALAWRLPWGLARSWDEAVDVAKSWGALP